MNTELKFDSKKLTEIETKIAVLYYFLYLQVCLNIYHARFIVNKWWEWSILRGYLTLRAKK